MTTKTDHDVDEIWLIAWVNDRTGTEGIGTKPHTRNVVDSWIEILSREDPDIRHWAVKVMDKTEAR